MQPGRASILTYLLTVVSGLYTHDVLAVKGWDTNAGLTVQTIFSDNVDQEEKKGKSDVGIRITPSIGIRRDTRYNKLSFQYGLSFLKYFDSSENDDLKHNLTADWKSEIYRDTLFLDLRANADQTLLSSSSSGDDFNSGNTTQTYTYVFSPYTRHHFGNVADLEVRYTNDGVIYDSDSAGDSTSNKINFLLNSGTEFQRTSWGVNGSYRTVDQDDSGGSDDYSNARADVSIPLNRYWATNFYVAYEDNDVENRSEDPDETGYGAGITWTPNRKISINVTANSEGADIGGGVIWTPNQRTSLELSYGYQFRRENWSFDFSHRSRSGVLTASYSEYYNATSRDEILARQTFLLTDAFGNPITDPITGQSILVEQDSPDLDDETYDLSRFQLGYDIEIGRRNLLSLGAHHTNRDYQDSQRDEKSWGGNIKLSHTLAANLTSTLRVTWDKSSDQEDTDDTEDWSLETGLTYNLTNKTSLTLDLLHYESDSDTSSSGYTENRATLTLGTSW